MKSMILWILHNSYFDWFRYHQFIEVVEKKTQNKFNWLFINRSKAKKKNNKYTTDCTTTVDTIQFCVVVRYPLSSVIVLECICERFIQHNVETRMKLTTNEIVNLWVNYFFVYFSFDFGTQYIKAFEHICAHYLLRSASIHNFEFRKEVARNILSLKVVWCLLCLKVLLLTLVSINSHLFIYFFCSSSFLWWIRIFGLWLVFIQFSHRENNQKYSDSYYPLFSIHFFQST